MLKLRHIAALTIATLFVTALAIDSADARRGGGGGMRGGGGFGGGGMRVGAGGGRGFAGAGPGRAHVSHPIARPGRPGVGGPGVGNRPGWGNRPGYGGGWAGYRPGYGWGAAAAAGAVGAGLAYGSGYGYGDPYYGAYGYNYADVAATAPTDAIAECARRFKTYDPGTQTYIRRPGERASCP